MTAEEYSKQKEKEACCGTEFCTNEIAKAFNDGMEEMKQRLMKDAMDGVVFTKLDDGSIMVRTHYFKSDKIDYLDEVKLIIIKEE